MSIFANEAATAILREAAEKFKAIGLHTEIAVSGLPQGDALVLFVSDTNEGAEASSVALTEGGTIAHSDSARFTKEIRHEPRTSTAVS